MSPIQAQNCYIIELNIYLTSYIFFIKKEDIRWYGYIDGNPKCELYGMGTVPSAGRPASAQCSAADRIEAIKYILHYFKVDLLVTKERLNSKSNLILL